MNAMFGIESHFALSGLGIIWCYLPRALPWEWGPKNNISPERAESPHPFMAKTFGDVEYPCGNPLTRYACVEI
ncbi:MAG: hypothetical protein WCJ06_10395 [Planctomycetota bacterium]